MANAKTYNELRSANLHENRRMLAELGVRMPRVGEKVVLNKPKLPPRQPKQRIPENFPEAGREEDNELGRSASRSFRVRLKPKYFQEEEGDCIFDPPKPSFRGQRPPPSYGKIPGVEVGREWQTRMQCSEDLIHRPTVAGIHGGPDGAYSVALSGGYEDDIDFGESFTYTGEGGRDLKGTKDKPKNLRTAPQSKDQSLDRGNLALARSVETQNPVRVVRGYKLDSQYAPEEGYRYDGLYLVKKYWVAVGKSGFKVWKFAFIRCDSEPAPWVQMPFGSLGSPTSPTTPASIPQTGVEACEAPSLDTDDSEDYLQLKEAQIGAKQPDDRKRVKKKVSFNCTDYIKVFETESFEEEESEEPGRVTTRSSSAKAVKNDADNVADGKPAQLRKRSQRTLKPTAKVVENYSRGDKGPPKLVVSASPVVLITEMSIPFKKIRDSEGDKSPKKSPTVSKLPKMEKCSPVAPDLQAKGKNTPEKKSGRLSVSPEERTNKSPQLPKLKKSPGCEKSRKDPLSPSVREKPKSTKTLPDEVPRKRSISPDYPATNEKPSSTESSTDEVPRKRSISPEYLPEDELRKKQSPERASELSVSPSFTPADEKVERRGRPRKYPLSPPSIAADEKTERRGRPRKYPLSPPSIAADEKTERRGRPRKYPLSPPSTSVNEKTGKSPKSLLKDNRPKQSPTDKKPNKSPKYTPEEKLVERPVSPEYPPEHERSVDMPDLSAQEETKRRSVSPEHQQKKSAKSRDSPSKDVPAHQPKNLDKQSKSSRSFLQEHNKSPKSAEGSKQIRTEKSKSLTSSPEPGLARGLSPKKNNSLKQSPGISDGTKSPKSSDISKSNSREKSAVSGGNCGKKTQSPKEKKKQGGWIESRSRKRSLSSDDESVDIKVPMKKKPRVSSSKSFSETTADVGKTVETENDQIEEEKISESDLSSERIDDAPMSPESMEDEAPMECESEDPPNLTLAIESETKKGGKKVPDTLTPPETETSNSSSPNPTPPSSLSSPASSAGALASVSRASVNDKPRDILDNDEFPSDEEILNMMQFSLGACMSDGPKVVVKMENGKWIEMEENDTATKANVPR